MAVKAGLLDEMVDVVTASCCDACSVTWTRGSFLVALWGLGKSPERSSRGYPPQCPACYFFFFFFFFELCLEPFLELCLELLFELCLEPFFELFFELFLELLFELFLELLFELFLELLFFVFLFFFVAFLVAFFVAFFVAFLVDFLVVLIAPEASPSAGITHLPWIEAPSMKPKDSQETCAYEVVTVTVTGSKKSRFSGGSGWISMV